MIKRFLTFLSYISILTFISCETKDQDTIHKAQNCLNHADGSEALTCQAMVDGMESKDSYVIRCSAQFINEGITASKMAEAFNEKDKTPNTGSYSNLVGMFGVLSFKTQAAANTTYGYCQKTGLESFKLFSSMVQISTNIAAAGNLLESIQNGQTPSQEDMEQAIDALLTSQDETTLTAIGNVVLTNGNDYCAQEKNKTTDFCKRVNHAVANGTTPTEVGEQLLSILQSQSI